MSLCECVFVQHRQSQMPEMPEISSKCQNNGFSFCLGSLDVTFEISLKESESLLSKGQYNMTVWTTVVLFPGWPYY